VVSLPEAQELMLPRQNQVVIEFIFLLLNPFKCS